MSELSEEEEERALLLAKLAAVDAELARLQGEQDERDDAAFKAEQQRFKARNVGTLAPTQGTPRRRKVNSELEAAYAYAEDNAIWDYESIKVRAAYVRAAQGKRIWGSRTSDYLVETTGNDPYYVGTPADLEAAEWIVAVYRKLGFTKPAHIRAIHYAIRSRGDITLPSGKLYVGDVAGDEGWGYLQYAVKTARYLKLLDSALIVDHKNPEPKGNVYEDKPTVTVTVREVSATLANRAATIPSLRGSLPTLGILPSSRDDLPSVTGLPYPPRRPDLSELPATAALSDVPAVPENDKAVGYHIDDYRAAQRYYLEVWCEKSTMDDVLGPWCQRHNALLVTGEGEQTITNAYRAVQRAKQYGKTTLIIYVSDFDFKGQEMPVSIARKIMWYRDQEVALGNHPPDVLLAPAVLSHDQVKRFGLMDEPIPAKLKTIQKGKNKGRPSARWLKWKDNYGEAQGTVELDAVEGSGEGRLGELLDETVAPYYQATHALRSYEREAKAKLRHRLEELVEEVCEEQAEALDAALAAWDEATEQANTTLNEALARVKTELGDPLDTAGRLLAYAYLRAEPGLRAAYEEATALLDKAAQEALDIFKPVQKRAAKRSKAALASARKVLADAEGKARSTLNKAWKDVVAAEEAVEKSLDERMHEDEGAEREEWEPPLSAEAPAETLATVLFHSRREYVPQVHAFKEYQMTHGVETADKDDESADDDGEE